MPELNWTNWYCGVSHLLGLKSGFQVSIENRGEFCDVYALKGLQTMAEDVKPDIEQARQWAEEQARFFGIVR